MNLFKNKSIRFNEISLIYGVLSYCIVYIHTNNIPGGIDLYSLNLSCQKLTDAVHLLFSTSVPSFFILWGYLSHKYLSDDKTTPFGYLKKKILHFWPIYLFFSCFLGVVNVVVRHSIRDLLPVHSLILSILGFGTFFPAHIMTQLFMSLVVVAALKYCKKYKYVLIVYFIFLLVLGNLLPNHPDSIILANLFFHTAFCFGILVKEYELISFKSNSAITALLSVFGVVIYISNVIGSDMFFSRFPNSYGHLAISASFVIIAYNFVCAIFSKIPSVIKIVLGTIGTFAFAHMVIHIQIINLFNTVGSALSISPVFVQVVTLITTPIIAIYIIFPIYNSIEACLVEFIYQKGQDIAA